MRTPGGHLGKIVRAFKARASCAIRRQHRPDFSWQRGYYERIIRNPTAFARVLRYIAENPARWSIDAEYPFSKSRPA